MNDKVESKMHFGNKFIQGSIVKTENDKAIFKSKKYFKPRTKVVLESKHSNFVGIIESVLDKKGYYFTEVKIYKML